VEEIAPGIGMLDTLLGGMERVTAVHLVTGERTALVDAGARTSAPAVLAALAAAGLGPGDLAAIVLTHVHLDHCGATGVLAAAFPRAEVVVHRRGARHLAEPGRLVAASAEVYGARAPLYCGLDPTPPERITAAEDGHVVDLGGGRRLTMLETPGHARHHMSVLDEGTGTVLAGDAVGVGFPGSGLYPALPPPDVDPAAGDRSLVRLAELAPERLQLAHFGPVDDPAEVLALARRQLALMAEAGRMGPDRERIAAAVETLLPLAPAVGDPAAVRRWKRLGWAEANIDGLGVWAGSELL
jgi:glyoxylase-like metal-dependent hydrolase (beta-lactamase superfamily II)